MTSCYEKNCTYCFLGFKSVVNSLLRHGYGFVAYRSWCLAGVGKGSDCGCCLGADMCFAYVVTSFGLNNRKERPIPYLLTVACYLATAGYLYAIHAPQWLWLFMVAGAGAAVVSFIVNFWWKISVPMAAAAGLLAMAFRIASDKLAVIDMWPVITVAILLLGLLGTCRMVLKCHTLGQVLAGTANGFLWVYLLTI